MALAQEFRFAARMLAKNKGWTAISALALALGLGANVAIFSVARLMLWTPLPYPNAEQLVYLPQTNAQKGFNQAAVSLPDTRDWASAASIAAIAAFQARPVAVSGAGEPEHLPGMQVTPAFFEVLGVAPAFGRSFSASEGPETEARAAILSHELWQKKFGGDRSVLGREIRLDGRNYSIVGVMPPGFDFLYQRMDIWTPLSLEPKQRDRSWRGLNAVARLKRGVSRAQAAAEVRAISERIEHQDPNAGLGWRGNVLPLADRLMGRGARAAAGSMLGAVGFVLLIACANVASLLLARGALRRRELAVRSSLGASRGSIVRLQLAESLLLSVVGGAIGILSAVWTIPLLKAKVAPPDMRLLQTATLDWNALLFGLALSVAAAAVFGAIPAWLFARGDLAATLQDSSRGSTGGRHLLLKVLVVSEMALALVLVAASTLMIRSVLRQSTVNPGFDKTNLAAGYVLLPAARYAEKPQVVSFFSQALENVRRNGGVESAALVDTMPLTGNNTYEHITVEGDSDPNPDKITGALVVTPGYFQTMRIPLLAGRDFTTADSADSQKVAIVNETFAKRFWPRESNPAGRRVKLGGAEAPWITVVGLARDVRHSSVDDPPRPEIYRPHAQTSARILMVVARGRGGAQSAAGAIRSAVWQVDREQPIFHLQSLDSWLYERLAGERATAKVLGFLGVIALILAAVGTYGVMAYTAAQRVREIGIRLALGASQTDVFRMVLGGGLTLAAIGLAIGLPAAYGVTPLLRAINSGMDARDSSTYAGAAAVLFAAALAACALPAWRAMRTDPARVLRNE